MKRRQGTFSIVSGCISLLLLGHPTRIIRPISAFATPVRSFHNLAPRYFRGKTDVLDSKNHCTKPDFSYPRTRMSSSGNQNSSGETLRFHEIVEREEKKVPVVSAPAVAAKLLVVVPIWAVFVLPLTIAYQAGKSILGRLAGSKAETPGDEATEPPALTVDPSKIVPRPERKHDVVVLGATGFTGGLAVRHLAKTYGTGNGGSVRWAIAGRSKARLEAVLEKLAGELSMPELAEEGAVDTIVCDTSDASTLPALVQNTRSVATTAGPFSLYGRSVVEACAKHGTHYTDITGEASFVKAMKARFQEDAEKSGARIVSFCGNDSIPWDLSYNLLADEFASRSQGEESMESVEFADEFYSNGSGGTFKTMCMGMSGRLAKVNKEDENILRRRAGSNVEHSEPMENAINPGIKRGVPKPWKMKSGATTDNNDDTLVEAPFVMSGVNYEVVSWSHAMRGDPKCSYKEQLVLPDFKTAFDGVLQLSVFVSSLANPLTLKLFENYLLPRPGQGPELSLMEKDYFLAVTGTAKGSKGTVLQSLLYYNKCPGYLETARMVVESALCLALEEEAVAKNIGQEEGAATLGGFFGPGFALRKNLLKRLVDTGCHYEIRVVEEGSSKASSSTKESAGSAQ